MKTFFSEETAEAIIIISGEGNTLFSGYSAVENAIDGVFLMSLNSGICYCSRTPPLIAPFKIRESILQRTSLFPITFIG